MNLCFLFFFSCVSLSIFSLQIIDLYVNSIDPLPEVVLFRLALDVRTQFPYLSKISHGISR